MGKTSVKLPFFMLIAGAVLTGCGDGYESGITYFSAKGNSVTFENGFATYNTCGSPQFQYTNKMGKLVVDWSGCKPGTQCAAMGCNADNEIFTGDRDTITNQRGEKYFRNGSPGYYKIRDQVKAILDAREKMQQESRKQYLDKMQKSHQNR